MEWLAFITDPLSYGFMQRALIMAVIVGFSCAVFSCFLVLKGWSLMGDAVSHAVLPGIILAYMFNLPLAAGAFAGGILCGVATGYLKQKSRIKEDAVMGIVFSGMFALGLVLLSHIETELHLLHILFGNILGVRPGDLIEAGVIGGFAALIMLIKRRDFMIYCFDPVQARVAGLPVRYLHYALLILLTLTIVSALKAAGIILVIAMLIAPGATAFLLTRSFDRMLPIAIAVAVLSCLSGTMLSFHLDVATAPLIVVIQAGFFMLSFIANKMRSYEDQTQLPAG